MSVRIIISASKWVNVLVGCIIPNGPTINYGQRIIDVLDSGKLKSESVIAYNDLSRHKV